MFLFAADKFLYLRKNKNQIIKRVEYEGFQMKNREITTVEHIVNQHRPKDTSTEKLEYGNDHNSIRL